MSIHLSAATLIAAALLSSGAWAAGGQNAHNNPTGDPPADTYQTPYANPDGGRMMIFCAEGETLVLTPAEGGSVEATCIPAE
jgi:hypothetical protein